MNTPQRSENGNKHKQKSLEKMMQRNAILLPLNFIYFACIQKGSVHDVYLWFTVHKSGQPRAESFCHGVTPIEERNFKIILVQSR